MDKPANYPRKPLISVITCTKNSARYLPDCLTSLANQTYANIEHIIIDAASTDETLDIIARLAPRALVYQQTGRGLYTALNEGLTRANGDVIGFLHSDDLLADEHCLERVAAAFEKEKGLSFFCSRMEVFDTSTDKKFAVLGAAPHTPRWREWLYSSNYYAHPTYYCTRETIQRVGTYDESYRIAADVDWLIRLEKLKLPFYFDPVPLIRFRSTHGVSARHHILALREEWIIRKKNGQATPLIALAYGWHFSRRALRLALEKVGLSRAIRGGRKLIGLFSPKN